MKKTHIRILAAGAALALCLTGCRASIRTPSSAGTASPLPTPPKSESSAIPSAPGVTSQPVQTPEPSPPLSWPAYDGPSPMPPEGLSAMEGRMLWPIRYEVAHSLDYGQRYQYAFINEKGAPAISEKYMDYSYHTNDEGQYQYLLAKQENRTDIYTMDGVKIGEVPTRYVSVDHNLICAQLEGEPIFGIPLDAISRFTVYDIETGKRLLQGEYIHITLLSPYTAILLTPDEQEYLVDLRRGDESRIPLEGYANQENANIGQCLTEDNLRLMASTAPTEWYGTWKYEDLKTVRYGYLGADGKWAIQPVYLHATPFVGDYAGVHMVSGGYRFIDRAGKFIGDDSYREIYNCRDTDVSGAAFCVVKENGRTYYLDKDLKPIKDPKNEAEDGVVYYEGQRIEGLPARYTEILHYSWPVVIANYYIPLESKPPYLLNLETGEGRELPQPYYWINSRGEYIIGAKEEGYDVFDQNGNSLMQTVFQRFPLIQYYDLCNEFPYFWVETALYHGYADITGKWLYRESRFGSLTD